MTRTTSRLLIAGGLIVLLLGIVVVRRGDSPTTAAVVPSRTAQPAASRSAAQSPVADVKLELLKSAHEGLTRADRDPFRFQEKAVARPAPSRDVRSAPAPAPAPAPVGVPTAPPGPPPPPQILLKFIGVLDTPGRPGAVAILSDNRGSTFYGKEGDVIEGRYKVVRIDGDSVELSFTDGRGRQTLRLSGQ